MGTDLATLPSIQTSETAAFPPVSGRTAISPPRREGHSCWAGHPQRALVPGWPGHEAPAGRAGPPPADAAAGATPRLRHFPRASVCPRPPSRASAVRPHGAFSFAIHLCWVAWRRPTPRPPPPCSPFRAWAVPASVPAVIGLRSCRTGLALYCSCWRRRTAPGRHHAAPPPLLVVDLLVAVGRTPPAPCCFFLSLLAPAKQIPLFPLPCAPRP